MLTVKFCLFVIQFYFSKVFVMCEYIQSIRSKDTEGCRCTAPSLYHLYPGTQWYLLTNDEHALHTNLAEAQSLHQGSPLLLYGLWVFPNQTKHDNVPITIVQCHTDWIYSGLLQSISLPSPTITLATSVLLFFNSCVSPFQNVYSWNHGMQHFKIVFLYSVV